MSSSSRLPRRLFCSSVPTLLLAGLAPAQGAILIGSGQNITADTNVLTGGTGLYAYNWRNVAQVVNGVNFTGTATSSGNIGSDLTLTNFGGHNGSAFNSGAAPFASLSAAYRGILTGAVYNGGVATSTMQLNGLTAGRQYVAQVWVGDPRAGGTTTRTQSIIGGNTQTMDFNVGNADGGVGQYVLGHFFATGANQSFSLTGNAVEQINALQVRDVTNFGWWNGAGGATWDTSTTSNFSVDGAGTLGTFATAIAAHPSVTFADTQTLGGAAVTQNTVTIDAGGVSGASVLFNNSAVNYTVGSGGSTGISGTGSVLKQGTGTTQFNSIHTYTGGTQVDGGVLILNAQNTGTGAIRGAVTVNSGAELRSIGGGGAVFGYTTGQKIDTFNINGGLINNATGANHVWQATVNMTGGELRTNGGVSSNSTGNYFEWGNTGVNTLASASTATISGRIRTRADANANITFNVADGAAATDLLVSAAITSQSGATGIIKTGPGAMRLTGNNIYTGNTAIQRGTLIVDGGVIGNTAYIGNNASGQTSALEIINNATLNSSDYVVFGDQSGAAITITHSSGTLTNTGTRNNPGGNVLSNRWGHWGGGTTTYNLSGGTLSLTGAPLYLSWDGSASLNITGGTANIAGFDMGFGGRNQSSTINLGGTGTLNVGASGIVTGGTANKNINLQGGTLGSLASWSSSRPMNVVSTSTVAPGSGHTIDLSGALTGAGGLNKAGAGTFNLSAAGTNYAGATAISAGTFQLTNATGFNSPVSVGPGTVFNQSRTTAGNSTYSQNVTGTGQWNVFGNGSSGIGDLTLSGNNTGFTGPFTVQNARIIVSSNNNLPGGTVSAYNSGQVWLSTAGAYAHDLSIGGNGWKEGSYPTGLGAIRFSGGADVTGNVTLTADARLGTHSTDTGTISGAISGTGFGIEKFGDGTVTLANSANTYSGPTTISGGTLVVNTGSEQTLGVNPGAFNPAQLRLNNGTLQVTGASLNLNDANRGVTVGLGGTGSGTFNVGTGLTLSLGQTLTANTTGTLTKTGAGTFNLTADAQINALVVDAGNYDQMAGETEILTTTTGLEIRSGAQYYLGGGELKTDKINVLSGGTFRWGAGRLKSYSTNGNLGTTDYTGPGYHAIKAGLTTAVTANLDTESGSVLVMHGSPTLYLNNGVRFNNWAVTGNVDLTDLGDTLEFELNPYFLRPFSSAGVGAIETGSLPLLTWTGTFAPGGVFDSVTGINLTQGGGFTAALTPVTDPNDLLVDTWYIEYDTAAQTVWFHFKVSGYVPEPGSFGLLAMGALGLRVARNLAEKRRRLQPPSA